VDDSGLHHAGRHQTLGPIADDATGVREPESTIPYVQDDGIAGCPELKSAQVV
jgi:hypothetical protein